MGLDMYASSRKTKPDSAIDFRTEDEDIVDGELFYWRKHPNLHGWMQHLYVEKGGDADPSSFNCVSVLLTAEDLDRLEKDVREDNLEHTEGFFFGASRPDDKQDDLRFIAKAHEAIAAGQFVFYSSWW